MGRKTWKNIVSSQNCRLVGRHKCEKKWDFLQNAPHISLQTENVAEPKLQGKHCKHRVKKNKLGHSL